MQFRVASAFFIFMGSYFPLALILAVQDIPISWWNRPICDLRHISKCDFIPFSNPGLSVLFVAFTALSCLLSFFVLNRVRYNFSVTVITSKPIPNDIINYVFPYVVSFMGMSYSDPQKLLGFAVFLCWMFAITYKSGQIAMNPLLLMFGWSLYEASIKFNKQEKVVRVLKRGNLVPGKQKAQTIQDFYLMRD